MKRKSLGSLIYKVTPLSQQGAVGVTLYISTKSPGLHLENTESLTLLSRGSVSDDLK